MHRTRSILAVTVIVSVAAVSGCSSGEVAEESPEPAVEESVEESAGESVEGPVEESGEESGTELRLSENYDMVRNGARLTLAYDPQGNAFTGIVENTTNDTLRRVRVEVHLSNGRELGPTTPADLAPGEQREVQLMATSTGFDGWTAHPEVGSGEHGGGEESGEAHGDGEEHGEHGAGEERGEHDREGDREHR